MSFIKNKGFRIIVIMLMISIGFYSCSSSGLSNSSAADLLCKKYSFPSVSTAPLQYGIVKYGSYSTYAFDQSTRLTNNKMITFTEQSSEGSYTDYNILLTPEGEKYKVKDSVTVDGVTYHLMKTGDKVFGEIIGIKESKNGNSARVEFTWRYDNMTPIAEALKYKKLASPTDYYKSEVSFTKNANGWEVNTGGNNIFNKVIEGYDEELDRRAKNLK